MSPLGSGVHDGPSGDNVRVERTVTCRYLKSGGDLCAAPAVDPSADTLLCQKHIAGAVGALEVARRTMFGAETTAAIKQADADRVTQDALAQMSGLVYYAKCWDHIKIGTTTDITTRMREVKATEVLATEPGSHHLERRRHQQFAHLRVIGEYFHADPHLLAHVEAVRAANGPPITTTTEQLSLGRRRIGRVAGQASDPAGLGAARLIDAIRHR